MSKQYSDNEQLLLEMTHDLKNVFFGAGMASEVSEQYYKKLLALYHSLDESTKKQANIPDKALHLLEKNLATIKREMDYGNFYLTSLRYNFCDYNEISSKVIDIVDTVDAAINQYMSLFKIDEIVFTNEVKDNFSFKANRDVIVNIITRFLLLTKNYGKVFLTNGSNNTLEFHYEKLDLFKENITELANPLFRLSEMRVAFNLSLCYNYVNFLGGKVNITHNSDGTHFLIHFPTVTQ